VRLHCLVYGFLSGGGAAMAWWRCSGGWDVPQLFWLRPGAHNGAVLLLLQAAYAYS